MKSTKNQTKLKISNYMVYLPILLALFVMPEIYAQNEEVHLIPPIVESKPMSPNSPDLLKLSRFQQYRNWGIEKLGLDSIMNAGFTGKDLNVCICDTGRPDHPSLRKNIVSSENFSTDPSVDDGNGHSTHVAGIINEIAPQSGLLFAKVLNDNGGGNNNDVALGILWCTENGADVINLSLGSSAGSATVKEAIRKALEHNVVIVCAAGNDGYSDTEDRIGFPAKYDEVLSIGSIDLNKKVSWFSSSGENGDVMAPGELILSTWLNGDFIILSGTSMATPYISGAIALFIERYGVTETIETFLEKSAFDMVPQGYDRRSFWGYIFPDSLYFPDSITINPSDDPDPDPDPIEPPFEPPLNNWWSDNIHWLIIGLIIIGLIVAWVIRQRHIRNVE